MHFQTIIDNPKITWANPEANSFIGKDFFLCVLGFFFAAGLKSSAASVPKSLLKLTVVNKSHNMLKKFKKSE